MTPARGVVLIRRVRHAQTEGTGVIVLPEKTVNNWTIGQAEIVAVGAPRRVEEDDDREGWNQGDPIPTDPRLVPGAWVMTKPRSWIATDRKDMWVCRIEDVLAVLG